MYGLKAFFLHFIIAATLFRQVQVLQEAPISADLPPTPDSLESSSMLLEMKRGSPETQAWLKSYSQTLDVAVRTYNDGGLFKPGQGQDYRDIVKRVQGWVARSNDVHFTFFYIHDGDDNIQGGVGTWWFTPNELMSVVEREDKRNFEEEVLNEIYCSYRNHPNLRAPWRYVEDVFSHSIFYMVGMHKFPGVEAKHIADLLIPFIINTISQLLPPSSPDIWEFWVPQPLGPMSEKLQNLGFQNMTDGYYINGVDQTKSWKYVPMDFVQTFNQFTWLKVLRGYPLVALNENSLVYIGPNDVPSSSQQLGLAILH